MKIIKIKKKEHHSGFTLIEVLVAMILIMALGLGIVGLQTILSKNQVWIWQNYLSINQTNDALQTIVKELRSARAGDNGAYPLEIAFDQEIRFYSDIDYDGETEKIRYSLIDTQLVKGMIEPVGYPITYPEEEEKIVTITDLARNGETPIFYYYNGDWPEDMENNPLSIPVRLSDTKLMRVYLRLNPKSDQPDKDFILESYIQIRMLKENL